MKIGLISTPMALTALLLLGGTAHAQTQVTVETWLDDMMGQLPTFFCQPDQYFIQCFDVSQEECRSVSLEEARRCADEMADRFPPLLNMPDDGRQWGSELGRCAGIGYDRVLAERKSDAARCNPSG
mgnify:CR=1 FL=1